MNALDLLQQYLRRAALADNLDANSLAVLRSGGGGMFRDNRDTVERAPGQSDQGYLGGQLHPNALGIYGQPRQPPAGDEVIRSGQSYSAPIGMPTTLMPTTLQQWFNQGARGMQPISSTSPLNQMMPMGRRSPLALY